MIKENTVRRAHVKLDHVFHWNTSTVAIPTKHKVTGTHARISVVTHTVAKLANG